MPLDEETRLWCNSKETYELSEENNQTRLTVSIDALENYVGFSMKVCQKPLIW